MATYPPPNPQQGSIFNPSDWIEGNNSNLDIEYLNEHYCKFPVAQGSMSFAGINNTGTTTIAKNLVMTGTPNVNFLEFPDGTKQYTAVAGGDILNDANTWSGVNTFYPNPLHPYGEIMTEGITITNNQSSSSVAGGTDIVSYTPSTTIGFNIYSLSSTNNCDGVIPQLQLRPDGTQTILSSSAINGITVINSVGAGGSIQLNAPTIKIGTSTPSISFQTYGTLSATSPTSGILSNVNLTSTGFGISDGVNNNYLLYTNTSPSDFGLVIANTTGNNGTLTLSNNSTTLTTLTAETNNLDISTPITTSAVNTPAINQTSPSTNMTLTCSGGNSSIVLDTTAGVLIEGNQVLSFPPYGQISASSTGLTSTVDFYVKTQTAYSSSATYGDIASTQAFVQSAIQSQGSGDVSLAGINAFTGTNTFSGFCGTASIQGYPLASTNQFASIDYVNNLVPTNNNIGLTPSSGSGISLGGNIPVLRTSGTINFGNNSNTTINFSSGVSSWTFIMQNVNGTPVSGQTSVYWTLFNPTNYTYQPLTGVQTGYSAATFQFNSNVNAGSYVLYLNGYLLLN